jgi:hypothetical protein
LVCMTSADKSTVSHTGISLYVICFFSFADFRIRYLFLSFKILIISFRAESD